VIIDHHLATSTGVSPAMITLSLSAAPSQTEAMAIIQQFLGHAMRTVGR
jgi:hypothetical protein